MPFTICLIAIQYVVELAPRDDIESLAFVAFFLLRGNLPWKPRPHIESRLVSQEIIRHMKSQCSAMMLSAGFPDIFGEVLTYSHSLKFGQLPDFRAVRRSFTSLAEKLHFSLEGEPLDWTPCHPKPKIHLVEPEISIPDEKEVEDCYDDLGDDSYCEMDIDRWDRQGERDKDLTLSATLEAELDSITPLIEKVELQY
jgi:hypothetical protein